MVFYHSCSPEKAVSRIIAPAVEVKIPIALHETVAAGTYCFFHAEGNCTAFKNAAFLNKRLNTTDSIHPKSSIYNGSTHNRKITSVGGISHTTGPLCGSALCGSAAAPLKILVCKIVNDSYGNISTLTVIRNGVGKLQRYRFLTGNNRAVQGNPCRFRIGQAIIDIISPGVLHSSKNRFTACTFYCIAYHIADRTGCVAE